MITHFEEYGLTALQLKLVYEGYQHIFYNRVAYESYQEVGGKLPYWDYVKLRLDADWDSVTRSVEAVKKRIVGVENRIPKIKLDSTGTVSVDPNYYWQPLHTCPRACKVQLLGGGGVAVYGQYDGNFRWWKGWAPLPKINEELLK